MKHVLFSIIIVAMLSAAVPAAVYAQEGRTVAEWIDDTNAHRIGGYATLGLATVTATLGLIGADVHPGFGYTTAGFAVTSSLIGTLAYYDRASYAWPHILLNGIAATGFVLNAFVFEGGSPAHIATGITSLLSMYGAYGYIILKTR